MLPTDIVAYENPYCTLRWIEEGQYLHMEWRGAPTSEYYHSGNEAAIDVLRRNKGAQILFDTRAVKVLQAIDQAWFASDFMPRFVAAGLKRSAVLISESAVGAMSVANMVSSGTKRGLKREARSFTSFDEAAGWLASHK